MLYWNRTGRVAFGDFISHRLYGNDTKGTGYTHSETELLSVQVFSKDFHRHS